MLFVCRIGTALIITFFLSFTQFVQAKNTKVEVSKVELNLPDAIFPWTKSIFNIDNFQFEPYISCRPVVEFSGPTLLCLSLGTAESMLKVLGRASIFSEGNFGFSKGSLVSHDEMKLRASKTHKDLFGFNLEGAVVLSFLENVDKACPSNPKLCLNDSESTFFSHLKQFLEKRDSFLITSSFFPIFYGDKHMTTISHELFHAHYFSDSSYRSKVSSFWKNKVSQTDREEISELLSEIYDVTDDFVLLNEFQAHTLQLNPQNSLLEKKTSVYRTQFIKFLDDPKILKLQLKTEKPIGK